MKPGNVFVAIAGSKSRRAAFRGPGGGGRRGGHRGGARPQTLPAGIAFIQAGNARRFLARSAAKFFPRQPATIAAVTGTSGKTSVAAFTRQIWAALGHRAASIGTVGVVTPERRSLRLAHHARSGGAASAARCSWRARASRIWRWRPPRTASTSTGSTACALRRAPSPISAATISIIIRRWRHYLAAKLRLFEELIEPWRHGGRSTPITSTPTRSSPPRASAACACSTVGRNGDGIRLLEAGDRWLRAEAPHRHRRAADSVCGCRWSAAFRWRMRWSPPGLPSRPAAIADKVVRRAGESARRKRPARTGRRAQRRAGFRRLRAQARRAGQGAGGAAALCDSGGWWSCSAPAATAIRASGR